MVMYGHATSGMDPRRFTPDREINTPAEIAAWEEALAHANAGEPWDDPHPPIDTIEINGELRKVASYSPGAWGWGVIDDGDDEPGEWEWSLWADEIPEPSPYEQSLIDPCRH